MTAQQQNSETSSRGGWQTSISTPSKRFGTCASADENRGTPGRLARDDLPYGFALFDDRVGIGGYDETTGLMQVFVDTDAPIAREWAERVYPSVRTDSTPLAERSDRTN